MFSKVLVAFYFYINKVYRIVGGGLNEKTYNDVKNLLKELFLQFNKYLKHI